MNALEIVEHDILDATTGGKDTPTPAFNTTKAMKAISEAADMDTLKKAYMAAVKAAGSNKAAVEELVFLKDFRKAELEKGGV